MYVKPTRRGQGNGLAYSIFVLSKLLNGQHLAGIRTNRKTISLCLLPLSPSSIIWYQRKLGSKQAYRVVQNARGKADTAIKTHVGLSATEEIFTRSIK